MAPTGETYFPPLDRCFSGDYQLLNWETAYIALSQLDGLRDNGSLKGFLSDPQTTDLLIHALLPYSAPSPESKSSFETKTSAINVAPSSQARYDISQIKEDALWLSSQAKFDEVSALRIAVLEWQTRPIAHLLRGDGGEGLVDGNTNTNAASKFQSLIIDPRASLLARSATPGSNAQSIDSVVGRRERLLEIYLSERRYILKTAEYIVSGLFCTQPLSLEEKAANKPEANALWLNAIGTKIVSAWSLEENLDGKFKASNDSNYGFINKAVASLRSRLEALARGLCWSGLEDVQERVEIAWASNQMVEAVHILQLILDVLQISKTLLRAASMLPWFRLMAEVGFFEDFQPPYPEVQNVLRTPLQSLAALVSLDILRISPALELLDNSSTVGQPASHSTNSMPYLLDPLAMIELNEIFISVAPLTITSPAVLAWGIITQTLREIALTTRESRETRQSLRAADKYGAIDSSDTDGVEASSVHGPSSLRRRRSSTSSDTSMQNTLLEEIQDRLITTVVDEDPIAYLAKSAVDGGKVFGVITAVAVEYCTPYGFAHNGSLGQKMRRCLLELIRTSVAYVEYQPALIIAAIAVLTGSEGYWQIMDRTSVSGAYESAQSILGDPLLKQNLFLHAITRYPYEGVPFLQIIRAIALQNVNLNGTSAIWLKLQGLDTFTCRLPPAFFNYQAIREDENEDYVQLTGNLEFSIISPNHGPSSYPQGRGGLSRISKESATSSLSTIIPSGTQGRVMANSKPPVVAWNHEFSALSFMGKVLQCASITGLSVDASGSTMSTETVAETIALITVMLSQIKATSADGSSAAALESAESILGLASDELSRNQDVVSVIFQIFENELYKPRSGAREAESLEILVQCTQFTYSLLAFMPDRVWPFLGRSGLLSIGQDGTQMSNIISSQEMVTGRYEFLIGCLRLFEALIEDAVTNAVARKAPTKAIARFGSKTNNSVGVSQSTMERVLLKYEQTMIDVFESSMNWKFVTLEDRMEINYRLCSSFRNILSYCYEVDDETDLSKKLTSALAPATEYLLDVFLSPSKNDVSVQPLLHILSEGATNTAMLLSVYASQYRISQTISALRLITVLIKIRTLRQSAASQLVEKIFDAAPLLAKVYVAHESYKVPVVEVFDALVRSAGLMKQQPPSLLGHLGRGNASNFLDALSVLDQPTQNSVLFLAIWRLFSAIVSNRQQWFAIYLLTGSTPRDSVKDKTDAKSGRAEPILSTALDSLSDIEKLEPKKALAMLEFVALAAGFWPWILATMQQQGRCLKSISAYGARIGSMTKAGRGRPDATPDYSNLQLASYTADILAMYTRYMRELNDQKWPNMIVTHLTYLIKNAIKAPSYNASLQGSLRQNFASKFPGCSLTAFKRTSITTASLGDSYFYDLEFADKLLSGEPSWNGKKDDGFAAEIRRANVNLSVVEAQVNLFHSWKSLLLELSGPLGKEKKFQETMAIAVIDSLRTNTDNNLPEYIFDRLSFSRADLAFALIQRLTEVHCSEIKAKSILPVAWDAVRACNTNLGSALEGAESDYYRVLLRILYLALQINASAGSTATEKLDASQNSGANGHDWSKTANATAQTALEIISTTVAQGFRSLTMLLHSAPQQVHHSDFALLTAILRSCFQIPGLARNTSHLLTAFAETQTARCASTLLSWSDQLAAATSGDPIYGEYSILFLLEMSSVPALAESLAVDGVLSYILSTNLIRALQNKAFAPLDKPMRMYSIWTKGILPMLLNLLYAVGPPMAAEVAAALNTFPHQLARASSAFSPGLRTTSTQNGLSQSYLTLSMALEAQSIALIVSILRTLRDAGASAAVVARDVEEITWAGAQVKEDVESWLQRRGALRERIVPTNEREESMSRMKAEKGDSENRLEERVVSELQSAVDILSGGDL